jgi:hypothetical protein
MSEVGRRWLGAALFGTILMGLGSLLMVGIHVQTRDHMKKVLLLTEGKIKSDEQLVALNEIMTRGLMISLGSLGLIVLGVVLSVVGLVGFAILRRKARLLRYPTSHDSV